MKVYQVVDKWEWQGVNAYEEHNAGTETLGIFASVELAEKFIRQYDHQTIDTYTGEEYRITSDEYVGEGIKTARYTSLHCEYGDNGYHALSIIEQQVVEELD